MTQFAKILVPVDFSDHSTAAQETAVEIAKTFGAKIWLLHCYQLHPGGVSPYGIAAPASYQDDVREAVMHQLWESQEKIEAEGVPAETSVSSEFPPQAIIEMAEDIGADLIVMGTSGPTGFKHLMLGSVAERTVRLAPCPVLTVKAEVANRELSNAAGTVAHRDIRRERNLMNERARIVSEIMQTEFFSVQESDRLGSEQVIRLGWVQNIPVLDGTRLAGIVSSWDLLTAALSKERENQPEQRGSTNCTVDVKGIMTRQIITIDPDATLGEAAELMALHRIDCLPMVAADRTLLGLVTKSDLIRATLL